MVKINPKSKIWFLTRIGKDIEWRIEKRKRICLQNLILSRSEREFFSKSRISRGEREFFLQNLDIREHLEKWKFNSPARDRKKWTISSRDFLEIEENLVNAWSKITQKSPITKKNGTFREKIICLEYRGERERLFGSREREGKLKITFPFYGKGTGIRKLLREGKGREIWGL